MDCEPDFSVTTSWLRDELVVAAVHGESDIGTATLLEETLSRLVDRGANVVVDLTDVPFFDLTTVRVLLSVGRSLDEGDRRLVVVLDAWGRRVIGLAGLRDELAVAGTVDEAVASVASDARSHVGR